MPPELHAIRLTVNGRAVQANVEARLLLVDFIRHHLRLTGSHVGCAHGVCGACTILVDGRTARSCLIFAVQADGMDLRTIEGLAVNGALSPLQEEFHRHHALQCGYCTPGMLMSATALLAENAEPTDTEIRAALSGNLCRCTGYVNIVQAVKAAARRQADEGSPSAPPSPLRAAGGER
jgi:aerobic-type carbon monoxide dehydrogenase small subunit (CoxS/CutS family)